MKQAVQPSIDVQEAMSKIRSHWLSHFVHELRGPLFAARGYAKLLLDEKAGEVTGTQRSYLETILENINKLSGSVSGLAQIPSSKALNLEMVDLFELVDAGLAGYRKIETLQIREHISAGPAATIGDRAKLGLAVHKLLGAMVEFSRCDGKMDVYARCEENEFLLRITGTANVSSGRESLPEFDTPCQIIRLHGGAASADCRHPGQCNVSVRLPLIQPGADGIANFASQQR